MYRFDIKTASWHVVKQKDDLPGGREGHTLCLHEEQIILFAGFKDGNKVNDLVKFSVSSSKWTDI
jgi:N-acetylneuraminic acid mutarotase